MKQFPMLAMNNRHLVEQSNNAGCFKCCKIFPVKNITEYTDNNTTCICPECGVDTIIGDMCGIELTEDILKKAHDFWFA